MWVFCVCVVYFVCLRSVYCIQCLQLPIPGCPVSFQCLCCVPQSPEEEQKTQSPEEEEQKTQSSEEKGQKDNNDLQNTTMKTKD